jgi:hypothetical protein
MKVAIGLPNRYGRIHQWWANIPGSTYPAWWADRECAVLYDISEVAAVIAQINEFDRAWVVLVPEATSTNYSEPL